MIQGRVLYLVRHGQYHSGDTGSGMLTSLGKKQAHRVADCFQGISIDSIRSSTMPRAVETADIMAKHLGVTAIHRHRLLREVLPTTVPGMNIPLHKRVDGSRRVERIVERFFKPSRRVRHEIVVCHGNLIRALLLCVVSGRSTGWHRLMAHHGGITSFVVSPKGVLVLGFDVQEHLPLELRSNS